VAAAWFGGSEPTDVGSPEFGLRSRAACVIDCGLAGGLGDGESEGGLFCMTEAPIARGVL